jgi:hypothetical protein
MLDAPREQVSDLARLLAPITPEAPGGQHGDRS